MEKIQPLYCYRVLFSPNNKQINYNRAFGTHCIKKAIYIDNTGQFRQLKRYNIHFRIQTLR